MDSTLVVQPSVSDSTSSSSKSSDSLEPKAVEAVLRPRTEATLRAAVSEFKQQFGSQPEEEYKITVLVCSSEDEKTASHEEVQITEASSMTITTLYRCALTNMDSVGIVTVSITSC